MIFAGKYCNVKASGVAVPTTGEATTDVGGVHTTYQITSAAHQVLDPQAAVTVKKNGVAQSAALYTVDRLFGRVKFLAALLGTDVVTIDASYLPMSTVAQANGAQVTHMRTPLDATNFASAGNMERVGGLQDATGSIDRFAQVDGIFDVALAAGSVFVVEFWRNQTTVDWRAWAILEKDDIKASVAELVGESISFSTTPDKDGRSVSHA